MHFHTWCATQKTLFGACTMRGTRLSFQSLCCKSHTSLHTSGGKKKIMLLFEKNLSTVHKLNINYICPWLSKWSNLVVSGRYYSLVTSQRLGPPAQWQNQSPPITRARSRLIYEAINILLSVTRVRGSKMQHGGYDTDTDPPFPSSARTENCFTIFRWKAVITLIKDAQINQSQTN